MNDFEWTYEIEDIPIGGIILADGLLFNTRRGSKFRSRIHLGIHSGIEYYLRVLEIHGDCIECQTFTFENGDYYDPIFICIKEGRDRFFKDI
jgi:hypothetical protein